MTSVSESARMTSAHESQFRIEQPNARPRSIAVIAIDRPSCSWLSSLRRAELQHARFFDAADLVRDSAQLTQAIAGADVAVMLATAGADHHGIEIIGAECSRHRVSTTAMVHCPHELSDDGLFRTLRTIRPWLMMLIMVTTTDYVEDVLRSMGA
jgi:hypothetical protein